MARPLLRRLRTVVQWVNLALADSDWLLALLRLVVVSGPLEIVTMTWLVLNVTLVKHMLLGLVRPVTPVHNLLRKLMMTLNCRLVRVLEHLVLVVSVTFEYRAELPNLRLRSSVLFRTVTLRSWLILPCLSLRLVLVLKVVLGHVLLREVVATLSLCLLLLGECSVPTILRAPFKVCWVTDLNLLNLACTRLGIAVLL